MQKNKNKFIYFIIILIVIIIGIGISISLFFKSVDRNSYLELVSGEGLLNDKVLQIGKKEKLSKEDIIETKTKDSLAIIEWGDGSITRLGGNTKVKIENQFVAKNKDQVNILFRLFSGKTWSNVVTYLGEDSYFNQTYSDTEIAVRGTVYVVDADNDYLQVESHKVELTNKQFGKKEVTENKQLKLSNFEFISLDDFIKFFKDKGFFELNQKLDKEYLLKLSLEVEKRVKDFVYFAGKNIDNLTKEQREKLYKTILSSYQNLNFVSLENSEKLFNLKIALKEKLIDLAPDKEKPSLLSTFSYDLKDIFKNKNFGNFEKITDILKENQKYLDYNNFTKMLENLGIKFDLGDSLNKLIDTFKEKVLNSANYKEFLENFSSQVNDAIIEQKNIFLRFFDWIKDLFN
ncbi:hypothetical protein BLD25_00805 [Candidatus Gracilibacteria bacterium GN02-872]|nr:hypothetical protein BLD25_00805 [Candidatus Gracilibacteria bacterium GN02-872]